MFFLHRVVADIATPFPSTGEQMGFQPSRYAPC
uniref:Uncharacterized protein n=1 Tax=Siphoviridae sp. ctQU013 TaxID=2826329 RepID=A0A8S5NLP0_9CAUD|nr:MAG TPA: hypothetical protein [Siphoviridae sp. ctQU013]